jgi:hypothetical protein
VSRGSWIRLPTSPKIAGAGYVCTYPAVGRVARGNSVLPRGLDVPMTKRNPGVSLKSGRSAADSAAIRSLLWDYYQDRISRAELDDGIEAVKRFGATQPDLW